MCFYYDDGYAEMTSESVPTARKDHRCHECRGVIPRGEQYKVTCGKFDGEFFTHKVCRRCCWDINRVVEHEIAEGCAWHEAWPPFGDLVEHLEQTEMGQTDPGDVPERFRCDDQPSVIWADDRRSCVVASRLTG